MAILACTLVLRLAPDASAGETVVLAAEDDWAPYSSMKADRSGPEGFAVDLVREVFKSQGIDVRFETVPFARCMLLAKKGAVAGCFNATVIDDNRDEFFWHATPMFEEDLAIFGMATDSRSNLGLIDLEGKTVGYTLGYTYPTQFGANPRIQRRSAKSDQVLIEMLGAGRVDYILLNTMPGYLRIKANPAVRTRVRKVGTISTDGFWVAFSKAGPDGRRLSEVFEKGLMGLRASGRYKAMDDDFRRRLSP